MKVSNIKKRPNGLKFMSGLCQPPEQVFELNMGQLAGTQYQELLQEQLPEQVDHCQFALVAFKSHGSNTLRANFSPRDPSGFSGSGYLRALLEAIRLQSAARIRPKFDIKPTFLPI